MLAEPTQDLKVLNLMQKINEVLQKSDFLFKEVVEILYGKKKIRPILIGKNYGQILNNKNIIYYY